LSDLIIVGDLHGSRLMMCVEFVADKATKQLFPDKIDIGKVVSKQASGTGLDCQAGRQSECYVTLPHHCQE